MLCARKTSAHQSRKACDGWSREEGRLAETHVRQVADLEATLAEVTSAAAVAEAEDDAARIAAMERLQEHDSEVHRAAHGARVRAGAS